VSTDVKYPKVKVKLVGKDGNAFGILAKCQDGMRKANIPQTEINKFMQEATSGDYDYLL